MSNEDQNKVPVPRRGIYLLPNLFTVGAMFAGFYAIVQAAHHQFATAAIAIFVAMLLDSLDGRIARLTHSQSEFGAQMDSLSDMICFGVTPSLVLYSWSLSVLGKFGWLAAFFYTVCAALRLARFNSQTQSSNKRYFQGLSTTASAGLVASVIWVCVKYGVNGKHIALSLAIFTVIMGLLQVSTIRYRSFKDLDLRDKVPFVKILIIVLIFVFISVDPPMVFLLMFLFYVLSGPAGTLWLLHKQRKLKKIKSLSRKSRVNQSGK